MEWSVSITAEPGATPVGPDDLARLAATIDHHDGVVSGGEEHGPGIRIYVVADDARSAADTALAIWKTALADAGVDAGPVVQLEVTEWARLVADNERPSFPELLGVQEVGKLLGVSRQRVGQLREKETFPTPVAVLAAGPVWTRPSLQRFLETWERKPGRPIVRVRLEDRWWTLDELDAEIEAMMAGGPAANPERLRVFQEQRRVGNVHEHA